MKIILPAKPNYSRLFEGVSPLFQTTVKNGKLFIETPIEIELRRYFCKMSKAEFKKFFEDIMVEGGKKLKKREIIIIRPHRETFLNIRVSASERELIKNAAGRQGKSVAEYARSAILDRVLQQLEE